MALASAGFSEELLAPPPHGRWHHGGSLCERDRAMRREEARDVLGQVCSVCTTRSYGNQPGSSENYIVLLGHQRPNDLVTFSSALPLKDSTLHWDQHRLHSNLRDSNCFKCWDRIIHSV